MVLMAVAGVIVALNIATEDSVRVIVTAILTGGGYVVGGAALLIILRNVIARMTA